jgi:YVTN family beta-propeller protein
MRQLPTGTVTTLFTDVEGSTRLLQKLGRDSYLDHLRLHRDLLRAAFARHGGVEVEMQGDSFHFSFASASGAVRASADAQRALAEAPWPHGEPIRIRVGIHTGEPGAADGLYVGLDIHRAARIMAAAHGGQILLSETTAGIVRDELPPELSLRDLGEHRLKDLDRPERVSQLVIDDLPSTFPTLRGVELLIPDEDVVQPRDRVRRLVVLATLALLVLAIAAGSYTLARGEEEPVAVSPNSVAAIDPATNRVVASVGVGSRPTRLVADRRTVWALNTDEQTISSIDTRSRERSRTISASTAAADLAYAAGALWVANAETDTLYSLDPQNGSVGASLRLHIPHRRLGYVPPRVALTGRGNRIWATGGDLTTVVVDAVSARVSRRIAGHQSVGSDAGPAGPGIAVGAAGVWATDGGRQLVRVAGGDADVVTLGGFGADQGISGLAVERSVVWAAGGAAALWEVQASSATPERSITVGSGPQGVALGAGDVWTANAFDGTVSRVDPQSSQVTTITLGGAPNDIVYADGLIWVSVD